jgi:hypothetical protein
MQHQVRTRSDVMRRVARTAHVYRRRRIWQGRSPRARGSRRADTGRPAFRPSRWCGFANTSAGSARLVEPDRGAQLRAAAVDNEIVRLVAPTVRQPTTLRAIDHHGAASRGVSSSRRRRDEREKIHVPVDCLPDVRQIGPGLPLRRTSSTNVRHRHRKGSVSL